MENEYYMMLYMIYFSIFPVYIQSRFYLYVPE